MFHDGQTGVMITLDAMLPTPDLYAVGALSDHPGEITVLGGEVYLSFPDGTEGPRTRLVAGDDADGHADVGATLLVPARVPAGHRAATEDPTPFEALDEAIGKLAFPRG